MNLARAPVGPAVPCATSPCESIGPVWVKAGTACLMNLTSARAASFSISPSGTRARIARNRGTLTIPCAPAAFSAPSSSGVTVAERSTSAAPSASTCTVFCMTFSRRGEKGTFAWRFTV